MAFWLFGLIAFENVFRFLLSADFAGEVVLALSAFTIVATLVTRRPLGIWWRQILVIMLLGIAIALPAFYPPETSPYVMTFELPLTGFAAMSIYGFLLKYRGIEYPDRFNLFLVSAVPVLSAALAFTHLWLTMFVFLALDAWFARMCDDALGFELQAKTLAAREAVTA